MEKNIVTTGDLYRHFKGKLYMVMQYPVQHTETGEMLVVYRRMDDNAIFARPVHMFTSKVDREKYPNAKQKYRFKLLKEIK